MADIEYIVRTPGSTMLQLRSFLLAAPFLLMGCATASGVDTASAYQAGFADGKAESETLLQAQISQLVERVLALESAGYITADAVDGYVTADDVASQVAASMPTSVDGLGGGALTSSISVAGSVTLGDGSWTFYSSGAGGIAASCSQLCAVENGICTAAYSNSDDVMSCDESTQTYARCLCLRRA